MKREEILKIYDREYGAIYNESFLLGPGFRECTEFEANLINGFLRNGMTWLDVACGTGYMLSRFPEVDRSGLDISPAMIEIARQNNPGVNFYEQDFRDAKPELADRWDLVSCMWYAYCYADSIGEVDSVVKNLASWMSPAGTCFLPVCDPNVLTKTKIPYQPPADSDDGRLLITGVVWTWVDEPSGRQHPNLIAPTLDYLLELLGKYFREVNLLEYPAFDDDCLEARRALIARGKF